MKYHINTYGCQMNVHESEKLAGILENRGFTETEDQREADIIIFNTCCVRETAETKILGNLGIVKKIKEQNPGLKVCVCGCMAQKKGEAERLKKRCPFINLIFGTHNLYKFDEYLEKIVPYVRGREKSRPEQDILRDVESLVKSGYKEITLLGQNVNSYGNDFESTKNNFARLLDKCASFEGDYKIRFMTSHPKDLSEDVVRVISQNDKLAKFIHLPVQAGSDRILELMNRRYSSADYLSKIDMIRKYIPNVGLSSDIMVGFPTETEEDFEDTLKIVSRVRFNNLFTFIYSRRSGTPAYKMQQVDYQTKKSRIKRLIDLQFDISCRVAEDCTGKIYRVLCDNFNSGKARGKTSCEKTVYFDACENIENRFVDVEITHTKNSQLFGRLLEKQK